MLRLSSWARCLLFLGTLLFLLMLLFVQPSNIYSLEAPTPTAGAFVEAMQLAKVRAGPAVTYAQIGTIVAGETYPIVGRSSHFPWYLISLPNSLGWVYASIVKVTGNLDGVPWKETIIDPALVSVVEPSEPTLTAVAVNAAASSPEPLLPPTNVTVEAIDMTIVRYGPGTDFPRVGKITRGTSYAVVRRHARFQWLEIAYDGVASGRGWVYQGTVTVNGDLSTVPTTSQTRFFYPTLTPTPLKVVTSVPEWTVTPVAGQNQVMEQLSGDIYNYLLSKKFEPGTERQGSVFLMNLRTGHMFTVNPDVVYTAASLMKIPLMVAFYRKLNRPPTQPEAWQVANMMVCSDNASSDAILALLGDGDVQRGMKYVNETFHSMGLMHTTLATTLSIDPKITPTPRVASDPMNADANPQNQTTPADIGWLMSGIYQCAVDGSGPLVKAYPEIDTDKCRQMVNIMQSDKIGVMIEAGLPGDVSIAHKQGWVEDTHGDAAIVMTQGGDYILVVVLHARSWLSYESSFPTIAEISRMTYNVFNPARALDAVHTQSIPACSLSPDLINAIQTPVVPPIR